MNRWFQQSMGMPECEVDQVEYEVVKDFPSAEGPELERLIVEAGIRQWTAGTKCC
jgi:hypothetical protein